MRICMILEGSYPYVRGGVSSWMHDYILALPQHEFILWTIGAAEKDKGSFKYELPQNVIEVHEVFLDTSLKHRIKKNNAFRLSAKEKEMMEALLESGDPDYDILFEYFQRNTKNPAAFFISLQFTELIKELSDRKYPFLPFSDLFHAMRSMFLPVIYLMTCPVPTADVYHAAASGYSGVLGALASWSQKKPFILTEHGIYTREREEEILRSDWISPEFKKMWIQLFYMFSRCAYKKAVTVTSLFERAMFTQQDIGCPSEKCIVINNGIHYNSFYNIPVKEPDGWVDIGAIIRFAPIKDIKTLIYAFSSLKVSVPKSRLHILGGTDDEEYYQECLLLIDQTGVPDIWIAGSTDVQVYLQKLDFTVLTSISEGQPLAIIESLAAARPVVCTDVGCCRELVEGKSGQDHFGDAGLCCAPMDYPAISKAMERLCVDSELRKEMGFAGRQRVLHVYSHKKMVEAYLNAYERMVQQWPA
ncbi:MAG: GT4 family glycosyltransferase PelF [Ruminiclostridium sp.]|nr:GT4 family glycosyltransferase PelF [Ruminiclostridium sp.]